MKSSLQHCRTKLVWCSELKHTRSFQSHSFLPALNFALTPREIFLGEAKAWHHCFLFLAEFLCFLFLPPTRRRTPPLAHCRCLADPESTVSFFNCLNSCEFKLTRFSPERLERRDCTSPMHGEEEEAGRRLADVVHVEERRHRRRRVQVELEAALRQQRPCCHDNDVGGSEITGCQNCPRGVSTQWSSM